MHKLSVLPVKDVNEAQIHTSSKRRVYVVLKMSCYVFYLQSPVDFDPLERMPMWILHICLPK